IGSRMATTQYRAIGHGTGLVQPIITGQWASKTGIDPNREPHFGSVTEVITTAHSRFASRPILPTGASVATTLHPAKPR
ncbi:hypothetical protein JZM40_15515, partial [Acinetobacter pittii]|uniref:hypothetical protein n=1 Tax=Acinetobacter pittii TaxID=48296 RepID=UPI00197E40CD